MGFINNKNEIINNVALFEVLNGLPKNKATSSLESVRSKNFNLATYLVDLLSVTCRDNAQSPRDKAKCEAARILAEILIEFFPVLIKILKEGLARAIKAGLACNTNFKLPTFTVKFKLNIKSLDFNNLLKQSPVSEVGSMLYGKNATKDLNWFLHDLIQNGGSNSWKGIMDMNYNQTTQNVEMGINPTYASSGGGKTFDGFILDFTNSIEMISLEGFMARLQDKLTGSIISALNPPPSLDQLVSLEMVDALQDKIHSTNPCKEDYQFSDPYFTFSNDEMSKIEEKANQKSKGVVNLDLGCGIVGASVDAPLLKSVFNDIRNSPPTKVANTVELSINTLGNRMTDGVSDKDKKLAKASLNTKFIESIPKVLTDIVLEPKIVLLYQMCSKLVNGPLIPSLPPVGGGGANIDANIQFSPAQIPNGFDYAKATKVFFEYVSREALAALLEILFNKVKSEIIKLIQDFVTKLVKEQANKKIKALAFLTSGVVEGLIASIPTPNTSEYV